MLQTLLANTSAPSAPATQPPKKDLKHSQLKDKMFWGLNTKAPDAATATGNDLNHDDIALHAVCVSELDCYLHDVINNGASPMYDADDAFNN
jgi:hypothetical protein